MTPGLSAFIIEINKNICSTHQGGADRSIRMSEVPRQHNPKETKEMIIQSAIENFLDKGYSKTTLEDIVKRVGLTRGAFYWNFQSKKDILDEIVERYERFYLNIYDSYPHLPSARQTLRGFLLLDLQRKNIQNPYVTIIRYKVEASEEVADLKERQARMDDRFMAIIREEISRGQSQGEFRQDKDAGLMALVVYTYLLGFDTYHAVHYADNKGPFLEETVIEEYVEFLLQLLAPG